MIKRTEIIGDATSFLNGKVTLHPGDCLDVLRTLSDSSIDSCVTDPPYALVSIVRRFGSTNAAPAKEGVYGRSARGFMGKKWDTGERAFAVEFWAEVLRVLKPGGHVLAFGGTRTVHRLTCAIEDAGFEIRDMIAWLYGSGFPKSHNLDGEWEGWGTALKPALEPITVARKPLAGTVASNAVEWGTGALNIDGCRVGNNGARNNGRKVDSDIYGKLGSFERVDYGKGRWPANLIHDGSDEVVALFPETGPSKSAAGVARFGRSGGIMGNVGNLRDGRPEGHDDNGGSAARFFYQAKADSDDRIGSKHPTVKPLDLMRYLVRLVTPPGGVVLDPFAGTGTTGHAAFLEGFRAVLIERETEYQADIARRMELALSGPEERARAMIKASGKVQDAGPLFAGGSE